ncbi:hypothetical protein [uncultured Thiothrix sp.]|uniref:hypothetical protein n=1 Tax=uncultured Thiothrix sp. TaxID=223185 RepID=UPI00261063F9|nr:hypothetical protein [uncultured Thiothrix sp.]HMT94039.1 hypothetical protein [Thiolinea sp.]
MLKRYALLLFVFSINFTSTQADSSHDATVQPLRTVTSSLDEELLPPTVNSSLPTSLLPPTISTSLPDSWLAPN